MLGDFTMGKNEFSEIRRRIGQKSLSSEQEFRRASKMYERVSKF